MRKRAGYTNSIQVQHILWPSVLLLQGKQWNNRESLRGPITPLVDPWGGKQHREKSNPQEGTYRDPASVREMQFFPLFVPALNNCSKRLCLTSTDPWSVAAVRIAQNKLSLGEELTESTGQATSLLKSRNLKFPSRFGSCKVSDWDQKGEAFPREKQDIHTDLRGRSRPASPSSGCNQSLHRQPRRRGRRIVWSLKVKGNDHFHCLYSGCSHEKEKCLTGVCLHGLVGT